MVVAAVLAATGVGTETDAHLFPYQILARSDGFTHIGSPSLMPNAS